MQTLLSTPSTARAAVETPTVPQVTSLKLMVQGFQPMERRLLAGTALLSQRRLPRLDLIGEAEGETADVVMIDATDPLAMKWAADQPWLAHKTVIWVDAASAQRGHLVVRRPVQWPVIPMMLARLLEEGQSGFTSLAAAPVARALPHRSVLVVDDSLAVRAYLRSLLEPRGYAVTAADSAETGIALASATPFACILMDVLMPGIDGYEACRRIKARTRSGSGPAIVMLTSKSSPFDRIRGKMAGCDAYLTKPVATEQLHEVVARYTARPASQSVAPRSIAMTPQGA
jgi:two-component system, cell cycle response regulator